MPRDLASTSSQGERVLGLEAPVDQMAVEGLHGSGPPAGGGLFSDLSYFKKRYLSISKSSYC